MSQEKLTELHLVPQQSSLVNIYIDNDKNMKTPVSYPLGTSKADSAVYIMAGKKWLREKYGGIVENPPIYPGRNNPE